MYVVDTYFPRKQSATKNTKNNQKPHVASDDSSDDEEYQSPKKAREESSDEAATADELKAQAFRKALLASKNLKEMELGDVEEEHDGTGSEGSSSYESEDESSDEIQDDEADDDEDESNDEADDDEDESDDEADDDEDESDGDKEESDDEQEESDDDVRKGNDGISGDIEDILNEDSDLPTQDKIPIKDNKDANGDKKAQGTPVESKNDPMVQQRTIFVGNLPTNSEKGEVIQLFKKFGKIISVRFRSGVSKLVSSSASLSVTFNKYCPGIL